MATHTTTLKLSLIFFSSLYSVLIPATSTATATSPATVHFIRSSCRATTYPALCFASLKPYSWKIKKSPRLIAMAALSISVKRTLQTEAFLAGLARSPGLRPGERAALNDCLELVGDSVGRLTDSAAQLRALVPAGEDFWWQLSNLQTWVSAALTNEDTCMDGFSGRSRNGVTGYLVGARMSHLVQVTSNALALCNMLRRN